MKHRRDWAAIAAFLAALTLTCIYPPAAVICLLIFAIYVVVRILLRYGYDPNNDDDPLIH